MIEPYYIYVDVFCTHLFLHTVKSKAAGDLAGIFFSPVSVKCLPSQVCFNILSELANGKHFTETVKKKFTSGSKISLHLTVFKKRCVQKTST